MSFVFCRAALFIGLVSMSCLCLFPVLGFSIEVYFWGFQGLSTMLVHLLLTALGIGFAYAAVRVWLAVYRYLADRETHLHHRHVFLPGEDGGSQ